MDGSSPRPQARRRRPAPLDEPLVATATEPRSAINLEVVALHQAEVDADETATTERYARHREFTALVADAIRRAEAMTRLERLLTERAH